MNPILTQYARLLTHYCLDVQPGDRVFISTTLLAEPLLRELYAACYAAGAALVECDLAFRGRDSLYFSNAHDLALKTPPAQLARVMDEFECYLAIRAPFNLRENSGATPEQASIRTETLAPLNKRYFERTATRAMKRNLCQYPTDAAAQEAGMSLAEYEQFVFHACKLFEPDPIAGWLRLRADQQQVTDYLNGCSDMRYVSENTDISFSTKDRIWINSDGQTNMPSGEIYTSPVEDSVNGVIHFSYPCLYQGVSVEDVTLWVKDGLIEKWSAKQGQAFLDYIFAQPGARRFGEAAIGTNYDIRQMTKNILFDEKIGGTIHMAIGQSYLQTGGKNESAIHWDMITDMTQCGEIWADGVKIYEKGRFTI